MENGLNKNLIISILVLVIVIMIGGFVFLNNKIATSEQVQQKEEISREDELVLEGLINDYFYRRRIKDRNFFEDFDAYGSIVGKSIVVYVYAKNSVIADSYWPIWKEEIEKGVHETLLDFEDFNWAKDYSFDIVLREE